MKSGSDAQAAIVIGACPLSANFIQCSAGKITKLDEQKKTLKVEVAYTVPKLNEGEAQAYMNAQAAYQRAAANPQLKPQDRAQEMAKQLQDMQMRAAKLYIYEKKTREIELQLLDDAKIRLATPAVAFDDVGKPKKYTAKELAELKGDPKVPGYPAEFSSLSRGQFVQVTMVRKKTTKSPAPPQKSTGGPGLPKPKDTTLNLDLLVENLPLVSIIVVTQQAPDK